MSLPIKLHRVIENGFWRQINCNGGPIIDPVVFRDEIKIVAIGRCVTGERWTGLTPGLLLPVPSFLSRTRVKSHRTGSARMYCANARLATITVLIEMLMLAVRIYRNHLPFRANSDEARVASQNHEGAREITSPGLVDSKSSY